MMGATMIRKITVMMIFACVQFFYNIVGDWGLAIIIITVIFRIIVAPIMHKQAKSSYQMQKMQPLMNEIQTKVADDPTLMRGTGERWQPYRR